MKARRSLRRRSFSVSTAGWFTVLRPDEASAISRAWRSPNPSPIPIAIENRDALRAMSPSIMPLPRHEQALMRTAWIVLAASATTAGLLWWIMHP